MSEKSYQPFDQETHLGPPPWAGPALDAWEEAHGHDARLKCYPEFGCVPAVLAEAREAKADGWDEGYRAAVQAIEPHTLTAMPPNPYRSGGVS